MKRLTSISALAFAVGLGGCYHATIETGLAPSPVIIDQPWALSFVYGLVPPKTVETAAKCPTGVSKVETQLSFLNQLVSALTLGILTPMAIKVTCASGGRAGLPTDAPRIGVVPGATGEDVQNAFATAARLAMDTEQPVYVMF